MNISITYFKIYQEYQITELSLLHKTFLVKSDELRTTCQGDTSFKLYIK